MNRYRSVLRFLVYLGLCGAPACGAVITADFANWQQVGFFDPNYFAGIGLVFPVDPSMPTFTTTSINGQYSLNALPDSLPGPGGTYEGSWHVLGQFTPDQATTLAVSVDQVTQGTVQYTLSALDGSSNVISSVTQQATGPVTLDLGILPAGASFFRVNESFVQSPNPFVKTIDFAVGKVTFTSALADPVYPAPFIPQLPPPTGTAPEPATWSELLVGLAGFGLWRSRSARTSPGYTASLSSQGNSSKLAALSSGSIRM